MVPESKEYPSEPTALLTGAEGNCSLLKNIHALAKNVFTSRRETFVHAFSSYGPVYSFSAEGCTTCTPNHGPPAYHPY